MNNFFDLVRRMRAAQRSYFRTRSQHDLQIAKELEGEVDCYLKGLEAERGACSGLNFEGRGQEKTETPTADNKPRPSSIFFFSGGHAAVCDQFGKQMSVYAGNHDTTIEMLRGDGIDWKAIPEKHGKPQRQPHAGV